MAVLGSSAVPENTRVLIDGALGQKGIYLADEGVYKFVIPYEAAIIVRDWQTMSPNLGMNTWFAFSSAIHTEAIVRGEILLRPEEVDPVVSRILDTGLEISSLQESAALTGRRLYMLHFTGRGTFTSLANAIRAGMDQIRSTQRESASRRPRFAEPMLPERSAIDPDPLNAVLAMRGTASGGVYRAATGRRAVLAGEQIGREMGMSTWISIAGTNREAVAHGEIVAGSDEVQKVLKALRSKGASVVSVGNHTLGEHPELVFIRYRAQGSASELARMLRFVLEVQIGNIEVNQVK
jgi:hypothetical protein